MLEGKALLKSFADTGKSTLFFAEPCSLTASFSVQNTLVRLISARPDSRYRFYTFALIRLYFFILVETRSIENV